jgi:hypothetical protein
MTCDFCLNCGTRFASAEDADIHNWQCADCDGIGGLADPFDDHILVTPTGVVVHLARPSVPPEE